MTSLVLAILAASLLGSFHCAGMCGAFVAIAVGNRASWWAHVRQQAAYHGGRLASYLVLGTTAGALGKMLDLGTTLAGIRPIAAIVAGVTVTAFALTNLLAWMGVGRGARFTPQWMMRASRTGYRAAMSYPPAARAALIGLCTTLLPCGWLYAFVATSAGAASPIKAAFIMFVFWLGTLPMMAAVGAGARQVLGPMNRLLPLVTSIVMLVIGLHTVVSRASVDPLSMIRATQPQTAEIVAARQKPACCQIP